MDSLARLLHSLLLVLPFLIPLQLITIPSCHLVTSH